jgi:hypothetical protein
MESDSVPSTRCENALRGTALEGVELEAALEVAVALEPLLLAPMPEVMAFEGRVSTDEDGVYAAAAVVAFEPADDDPEDANDEEAPGPEVPEEALVWIYKL